MTSRRVPTPRRRRLTPGKARPVHPLCHARAGLLSSFNPPSNYLAARPTHRREIGSCIAAYNILPVMRCLTALEFPIDRHGNSVMSAKCVAVYVLFTAGPQQTGTHMKAALRFITRLRAL